MSPACRSDDDSGLGKAYCPLRSSEPDLRGWFAADQSRAKSLTFSAGDLTSTYPRT